MIFHIPTGQVDIQAGDIVQVSPSGVEIVPSNAANYWPVISVSGSNTTQVQIRFQTDDGPVVTQWIDTNPWILANMRPMPVT